MQTLPSGILGGLRSTVTGHCVLLAGKIAVALGTGMSTLAALPDNSSLTSDSGPSLDAHSRMITLARRAYVEDAIRLAVVLRPTRKTRPSSVPQ